MYITQITYIYAPSLEQLQTRVEEECIKRAQNGHLFFQALPLVPRSGSNTSWVQPLVFQYAAESKEVQFEYTLPRYDDVYFQKLREDLLP